MGVQLWQFCLYSNRLHPKKIKNKRKKLIIITAIIAACCAASTVIDMVFHHICRMCVKISAIFAWVYPFISVLPASMCYTGSSCTTIKTTLLTFIIASYVVAIIILDIYKFCHGFCNMIILGGIFFLLMCAPGDLGTPFCEDP